MKSAFILSILASVSASATTLTYKTQDACTNKDGEIVLTVSTELAGFVDTNPLTFPIEKCVVPRAPQYPGDDNCDRSIVTGWTSSRQLEILSAKLERVSNGQTTLIGTTPILSDFNASADPANLPSTFEGVAFTADGRHGLNELIFSERSWFYGNHTPRLNAPNALAGYKTKVQNGNLTALPNELREAILKDFSNSNSALSLFVDDCSTVDFQKQ